MMLLSVHSGSALPCHAMLCSGSLSSGWGSSDVGRELHDAVMCFTVQRCMAPRSTEKESWARKTLERAWWAGRPTPGARCRQGPKAEILIDFINLSPINLGRHMQAAACFPLPCWGLVCQPWLPWNCPGRYVGTSWAADRNNRRTINHTLRCNMPPGHGCF